MKNAPKYLYLLIGILFIQFHIAPATYAQTKCLDSWRKEYGGFSRQPWLHDIVWTGEKFVAIGDRRVIIESKDGHKWNSTKPDYYEQINKRVASNGKFTVIVGKTMLLVDENYNGWRESYVPQGIEMDGVAAGNNTFITYNYKKLFVTSNGGYQWEKLGDIPVSDDGVVDIIWDGKKYIILGKGQIEQYINNELVKFKYIEWPRHKGYAKSIAWNGTNYVVAGRGGLLVYSSDGKNWENGVVTNFNKMEEIDLTRLKWLGNRFIAVGRCSTVLSSQDGKTWHKHDMGSRRQSLTGIASSDDVTVIVGYTPFKLKESQYGSILINEDPESRSWKDIKVPVK